MSLAYPYRLRRMLDICALLPKNSNRRSLHNSHGIVKGIVPDPAYPWYQKEYTCTPEELPRPDYCAPGVDRMSRSTVLGRYILPVLFHKYTYLHIGHAYRIYSVAFFPSFLR